MNKNDRTLVAVALDDYLENVIEFLPKRSFVAKVNQANRILREIGAPESQWSEMDWSPVC